MKSPSFQARFAAVLGLLALIEGSEATRKSIRHNNSGLMSGPPGSMPGGFGGPQGGTAGQSSSTTPGLVSNSGGLPAVKQIAPVVALQGGSFYSYSQIELTSGVSAFTPPVAGMFLSFVHVGGGAGAGGLAWIYASPNTAIFMSPPSRDGAVVAIYSNERWVSYPVSYQINGTNIPSTTFVAKGTMFQAIVTCQTIPAAGYPDISSYRGIYVSAAPTTVTSTAVTITYDAQPGVARAILTWGIGTVGTATAGDNSAYWSYSAGGSYTQFVPCGLQNMAEIIPLQPVPAANTYTITLVTVTLTGVSTFTGAATIFY